MLVTLSSEFQDDGDLVATTLDTDPASFDAPPNARVERFVPHGPLLDHAACVVCHGGMGITQKAFASAGGPPAAADAVEGLLREQAVAV